MSEECSQKNYDLDEMEDTDLNIRGTATSNLTDDKEKESSSKSSMSDDDNSEEPEDTESEEEDSNFAEIEYHRNCLKVDPYKYDSYVSLVKLHKLSGDLDALREIRTKFSEIFPLTEEQWLEWINDEIPLAESPAEKESIVALFEKAVDDYLNVNVWLAYMQFEIDRHSLPEDLEKIRAVFRKACEKFSWHFIKGSLLWDKCIAFEKSYLSSLTDEVEIAAEEEYIQAVLLKRVLSPHYGMEQHWSDLECTISDSSSLLSDTRKLYQQHLKTYHELLPYEDKLKDDDCIEVYQEYLDNETERQRLTHLFMLYERAVERHPMHVTFWLKYAERLALVAGFEKDCLKLLSRSVRNCPWSGYLWALYIRMCERVDESRVYSIFNIALNCNNSAYDLQLIWNAYLDYKRRQLSKNRDDEDLKSLVQSLFTQAVQHLTQAFPYEIEQICEIAQYWAFVEAHLLGNLAEARDVWQMIAKISGGSSAKYWLLNVAFEEQFGDDKHIRRALMRALDAVTDHVTLIIDKFIEFERMRGTLSSLQSAENLCRVKEPVPNEGVQKNADKFGYKSKKTQNLVNKKKSLQGKDIKKRSFKEPGKETKGHFKKPEKKVGKRKIENSVPMSSAKKSKDSDGIQETAGDSNSRVLSPEKQIEEQLRTVFVSNLSYSASEDTLREIFEKCGNIISIRLVQYRGFGFIEFDSILAANKAFKLDRYEINGRPMYVSPHRDKKNAAPKVGQGLLYPAKKELNKLFIRGIPESTETHQLKEIFISFGTLKDVRLVTHKDGRLKGVAYVEFEKEDDAERAKTALDGTMFLNQVLSVEISNPPTHKKSLASEVSIPSSRPKPATLMVPRNLKRAANIAATVKTPATTGKGDKSTKKLNNEEFRNMFLKK